MQTQLEGLTARDFAGVHGMDERILQQERHCTCSVTSRRVRVTVVDVQKK